MIPVSTVSTSTARSAARCWEIQVGRRITKSASRNSGYELDEQVDDFDAGERGDDPAEAVDEQVATQHRRRAAWAVPDAAQGERDQQHDDDGVEDDRGEDRRDRAVQAHDVQRVEARVDGGEHRRDDGEV